MALSGSHGCERRWDGEEGEPARPAALDQVTESLRAFAEAHPGVIMETKSFGAGLHYRRAPQVEEAARALARSLAQDAGLAFQPGHMMAEVRVAGSDKGEALRQLMARPAMQGTRPVYLGDDVTDEHALEVRDSSHDCLARSLRRRH